MDTSDQLDVRWILPSSEAHTEKDALEAMGGNLHEPLRPYEPADNERDKYAHAAFEPLTILAAAFAVAFLAERLSRLAKDQKHSGLIIDLRTTPAKIWEEAALDRGVVYVAGPDGLKQVSSAEALDIIEAIKAFAKGM